MRSLLPGLGLGLLAFQIAAGQETAADIANALHHLSPDPGQTYLVRDLRLIRGDLKIYLGEGALSLVTAVDGHRVAAVFTAQDVDAGDAEIISLPPQQSERASLAFFTKSPNLDEHINAAIFLFSDDTAGELLQQIESQRVRKADGLAATISSRFTPLLAQVAEGVELRLVQALLDNHKPEDGFFYALLSGRTLGNFDVMYEPTEFEPISVGRPLPASQGDRGFQLWTSFRPRRFPVFHPPETRVSDYKIDARIAPDLSMSVVAEFTVATNQADTRVLPFGISERLQVTSAKVDGQPVEVFERVSRRLSGVKRSGSFLLVSKAPWPAETRHQVEVAYHGAVIRETNNHLYFVDERNTWYPFHNPTFATFDLTFRCPKSLRIVSTGELISDEIEADTRVVHRRTRVAEALAGFNLGNYETSSREHGTYRIDCYANRSVFEVLGDIPKQAEDVLDFYTQRWGKLPINSLTISPIPGYFGQGFPGLIFLSNLAYMREEDRPASLQTPRMRTFFDDLLLPHELAHQWWGNIVIPGDYRSGWLVEALSNYSALEYLRSISGATAVESVLDQYRKDLTAEQKGGTVESTGPLDLGFRLIDRASTFAWRTIAYEKGTWVIHMLAQRLGEDRFRTFENEVLKRFNARPITNDEFRRVASEYIPPDQPDRNLSGFFETWVHGTGLPRMSLRQHSRSFTVMVDNVSDDFTADVPLNCRSAPPGNKVHWVRLSAGSQTLPIPVGLDGCSLPSTREFLYVSNEPSKPSL